MTCLISGIPVRFRNQHTFETYTLCGYKASTMSKVMSIKLPPMSRGGHQQWQVGRMHNTDLIPDIRSKGVKDCTSSKDLALYHDLCQLLTIPISRDQIFHCQWKKHRALYLDFSKVTVWCWSRYLSLWSRSRHMSVIQGGGGGQGRVGGEGRTSFANWELNGPWLLWNVSHALTKNQRPHMDEIMACYITEPICRIVIAH
jgi:hypothetical protein